MKKFDEWYMPDNETHLTDHMRIVGRRVHGRLAYQYHKYELAKAHIKNFRNAIDVGAHIGLWSFFMAKDFETVCAFEPLERHFECWERNMEGVDNAGVFKYALGEKAGHVCVDTRTLGSSGDSGVIIDAEEKMKTIPMEPLDYFKFQNVDFIKIDCEGYEEFVLRGGIETLKEFKPCVIVEQKRDMSAQYGLKKQSAVRFLQDLGAVLRQEVSGDYILSWD